MKRRNADCGKIRRPIKRNKITEGMYGSTTVLYLKFLILWAIVITADFMFMFRFEFLWPFWLLLRSVHDSFKYKGLAFSVLFVCIAITSDLVCLFFIPVHWLLFAASTYVWVQYVWHTDKGICLPTIILWMLFVYLEAGIRWKDSRHMPHLDLCRPFAAHCIGYPVVTLGFGFKSYVGYRMRQRKQREVAKENEFYMQLLQQALPQEENTDDTQSTTTSNGSVTNSATVTIAQTVQTNSITADHHHHHSSSTTATTTSTTSSVHQNDDKNNVQIVGQITSSSQQMAQTTAAIQQTSNNNHLNLNNSSNSSSSSRNAQTNSKLNNNNNNVSSNTSSTSSTSTTTANGHAGGGGYNNNSLTAHKSHRRSMDKDKNDSSQTSLNNSNISSKSTNATNATADSFTNTNSNVTNNNNSSSKLSNTYMNQINQLSNHVQKDTQNHSKDKDSWDGSISSTSSSSSNNSSSGKENNKLLANSNNFEHTNGINHAGGDRKSQPNGNVIQYEIEEVVETTERKERGRRNRSKKDTNSASKDNHQNNSSSSHQSNNHHNHHNNNNNHQKDSNANSDSSSISSSSSTTNISNIASQIVTKICETCLRLETEVKKYRAEVSHMKQIENELRQKLESNATTKSCLQAKQRECDELDKRLQEITNIRQGDLMNLQNAERRLGEERRQRQSLEAQLNNEKKARKLAEEKATRPECSDACKQRKQQIEAEAKQLRRELKAVEDAKQAAEQQGRKCEQELRMFEAEVRSREAQQGTEVLMSALAAMQDKNSTLEKNLSAETRVKLDLFSALGEAKREVEIKDNMLRNKEEEVLDLKAKIAQLLAVMPTDSLCLPPCSTGSSMLRMNDTPPLQGPSSPMMTLGATHQQIMAAHQLNSRGQSVASVSSPSGVPNVSTPSSVGGGSGTSSGVVTQTSSNLDPNATAYTPKNSSLVGGAEA